MDIWTVTRNSNKYGGILILWALKFPETFLIAQTRGRFPSLGWILQFDPRFSRTPRFLKPIFVLFSRNRDWQHPVSAYPSDKSVLSHFITCMQIYLISFWQQKITDWNLWGKWDKKIPLVCTRYSKRVSLDSFACGTSRAVFAFESQQAFYSMC